MRDVEEMSREELLAELDAVASPFLRREARRDTTEQLRGLVKGWREQVAFYERMGFEDQGAPRQG